MPVFVYDVADTGRTGLLIGCAPTEALVSPAAPPPEEPVPDPPANVTPPSIAGADAYVGTTWSVNSVGSWSPAADSYTYQWLRGGGEIGFATSDSYVLTGDDVGWSITCQVTAVNAGGSSDPMASSNSVAAENLPVPVNTSAPGILGTVEVGQIISSNTGSWSYSPTSYQYQWQRESAGYSDIYGATSADYTVTLADESTTIRCAVAAVNASGVSAQAYTSGVNVPAAASVYQGGASISGNPWATEALTVQVGSWAPDPDSYAYQWLANGSPIPGATDYYYVVSESPGVALTCAITAYRGSTSAGHAPAGVTVIAMPVPSNTSAPSISGSSAYPGASWTCDPGIWNPNPDSYSYQWYQGGSTIEGQTSSSYNLSSGDIGMNVSCQVTAHNGAGASSPAGSNSVTVQELPAPPAISSPPTISGADSYVGTTWTCDTGSWSNSPTSYTYQWLANSVPIGGATSNTFVLAEAGVNYICEVTAHNDGGSSSPASANNSVTAETPPSAPVNTTAPSISYSTGTYSLDSVGGWTGNPPPDYTYAWFDVLGAIPGANGSSVLDADIRAVGNVSCAVTATNSQGAVTASSNYIYHSGGGGGSAPTNNYAPTISSSGSSFNMDGSGSWNGDPSPSISYQWLSNGNDIYGATGTSLDATGYDNTTISLRETATNSAGSASVESNGIYYTP